MKRLIPRVVKHGPGILFAAVAFMLAACQGGFGGTSAPGGVNPPVQNQGIPGTPQVTTPTPRPSGATPTPPPGDEVNYAVIDAPSGLHCPQDQGFTCVLQFSVVGASPSASPSPSPSAHASGSATPSPTPTPTPTPTPSPTPSPGDDRGRATSSPSASPTPNGPHLSLRIAGLPKDAPKMVNPDPKAVATVALVALRLRPDADITFAGKLSIDFTLPKEQIGGRGFALQLYHVDTRKGKTSNTYFGNYAKSKLSGTTLHFEIDAPSLQIKKDETWLLVLYGDELPSSPSPSPSASGSASASPSGSPSGSPSTSPSASPSPTHT